MWNDPTLLEEKNINFCEFSTPQCTPMPVRVLKISINIRPRHDALVIVCTCAITCINQEKGGLDRRWKAHSKVKLRGLIPPMQNSK